MKVVSSVLDHISKGLFLMLEPRAGVWVYLAKTILGKLVK